MYNTQHLVFKIGRTIFVWREQGYEFKVKLKAYERGMADVSQIKFLILRKLAARRGGIFSNIFFGLMYVWPV